MGVKPSKQSGVMQSTALGDGGAVIMEDRACVGCGYNLRGLSATGKCPECGRPAGAFKASRYDDGISNAPLSWLRSFAFGSNLLLASYIGMVLMLGLGIFTNDPLVMYGRMAAAVAWGVAVFWVTQPRPPYPGRNLPPEKEWKILRLSTRMTNVGWALANLYGVLMTAQVVGSGSMQELMLQILALVGALAGLAGVILLCAYCSKLSDWANETDLAHSFRVCCTGFVFVVIASLLGSLAMGAGMILLLIFGAAINLGTFVGIVYLGLKFWDLASMGRWAVVNHLNAVARDVRLREKAEKAMHAERVRPTPNSDPKIAVPAASKPARSAGPRPQFSAEKNTTVQRPQKDKPQDDAGDTYSLAPDEP